MKLDEFNKKIIGMLIENSRVRLSEISKKIKRSKAFVNYRIKFLEEEDIIGRVVAIKLKNLGYLPFRIITNGLNEITKLKKVFGVRYVAKFYDGYDVEIISKDGLNLQYLINLLKDNGHSVKLLYRGKVYIPFNLFGYSMKGMNKVGIPKVDEKLFWNVIRLIEKNYNLLDVSRKLNMNYHTLRKFLKGWEGTLIRGYSVMVDLSKFDIDRYVAYIRTEEKERLLKIAKMSKINYLEKVGGYYDFRAEFFGSYKPFYDRLVKISKEIFIRKAKII